MSEQITQTANIEEERSLNTYISYPYSYAFGKSTKTLLNDTLYKSLLKCLKNYGHQLAIVSIHENIEKTYNQLVQDVDRFANALRINCDLRSGHVVCVWTANAYFFVVAQYATAALGAILCPINAYYKAKEVLYALEKVKPKVLIMPGLNSPQEMNVNKFYKTFEEISALEEFKKTTIEHLVYIDGDQQAGLFRMNGSKIKTHLAKSFLNDKYSDNLISSIDINDKENDFQISNNLIKEKKNINLKNKTVNNDKNNLINDNGSFLKKELNYTKTVNGTTNGTTNGSTNGVLNNGKLTNGTTNQVKKLRLQSENGQKKLIIKKVNHYVDPDAPCALFFTSGTTGMPKAATLSHFNLSNNSRFFGERVGFKQYLKFTGKTAKVCLPVPIFHAFGAMLGTSTMSTCPVTIVMANYRYDVESTVNAIMRYNCTHIFAVPAMLIDIMNHVEDNEILIKNLYSVVTAATTVPLEVVQRFSKIIPSIKDIQIVYGATESSPIITSPILGSKMLENLDNVGVPLDFAEVKLVDKDTKEVVKIGEEGELLTRGPFVFLGYWNDEHQTKKVIQNNWYNTGDLAVMDSNGKLKIVGRTKEIIIRGGANIYPREIEEVLITHPFIHTAAVCGLPHDRLGEDVCCWIKFRDPKRTLTEKEVREFCKDKMAYFKVPRKIIFVEEFPMTQSGKVQKFRMREISCEKLGIPLH